MDILLEIIGILDVIDKITSLELLCVLSVYTTIILYDPVIVGVPEIVPLVKPMKNDGRLINEKFGLINPLTLKLTEYF